MPAELNRQFVDTNVLVYAFDKSAGSKNTRAQALLHSLCESAEACTSIQVLQEFYVTITRKVQRPLPAHEARDVVQDLSHWTLHSTDRDDLLGAIDLSGRHRISLWDALIVQGALRLRCATLWTEDMQDGQQFGSLTVRNPFSGA